MSKNQPTLDQQIKAFQDGGKFLDDLFYFYDWFCRDSSIENRARLLMPKVIKFVQRMNINTKEHYVFFKNNCPLYGNLYDDFRICDKETGNVIWTVTPKTGHFNNEGLPTEVWGRINDFNGPVIQAESWTKLMAHLNK